MSLQQFFPSSLFSAVISPVFTLMILVGGEVGVMTADLTDRSLLMVMGKHPKFSKVSLSLSESGHKTNNVFLNSFISVCLHL